ncbi:hypothetical protein PVAG01_10071 [Phlyctema vagabunda]|uniref:Uncharacterized protein n=1 Tax=Phlyctema vagabunda TaxID=108571 RepID=A0ABR4P4W0_9HELO
MGVEPPFLYDPTPRDTRRPYSTFDPKAVSRASLSPRAPRPKQEGPLISFNQHPDSYLIVPYGNTNAAPMSSSVKKWIKWTRSSQLSLRCLELVVALGLLVMTILIKRIEATAGWIMRIVPGVAGSHAVYGIYHLSRGAASRTPASSASYMLFASFFDLSIPPFYAFSAFVAKTRSSNWATVLSDQNLVPTFTSVVYYAAIVAGGLHLISFAISVYLTVTFRKITQLPPDMNPLEDNLTARPHKRNKSSVSTFTDPEKRNSMAFEDKRRSGAAYEDLGRPPTIPFLHTRTQSTESFSSYQSKPPGSRDSGVDLPSRQYQIGSNQSARSSTANLKRISIHDSIAPSYREAPQSDNVSQRTTRPTTSNSSSPKRGAYAAVPLSDDISHQPLPKMVPMKEAWYSEEALAGPNVVSSSSRNSNYQSLQQDLSADEEDLSIARGHTNGLGANPPSARYKNFHTKRDSPLSEISNNRSPSSSDIASESNYSQDGIDDAEYNTRTKSSASTSSRNAVKKYYGELRPVPVRTRTPVLVGGTNRQVSTGLDYSSNVYSTEKGSFRRDVSGKVAEEGRSDATWTIHNDGTGNSTTRFRKVSGMLQ